MVWITFERAVLESFFDHIFIVWSSYGLNHLWAQSLESFFHHNFIVWSSYGLNHLWAQSLELLFDHNFIVEVFMVWITFERKV